MTRVVSPSPGSASSVIPGAHSQQAAGSFPETYSNLSTSCVTDLRQVLNLWASVSPSL